MLATAISASIVGVEGIPVRVEVDVSFGLPGLTIVGLAGSAVLEARERVRAAVRNAGFEVPSRRITVNLAPANCTISASTRGRHDEREKPDGHDGGRIATARPDSDRTARVNAAYAPGARRLSGMEARAVSRQYAAPARVSSEPPRSPASSPPPSLGGGKVRRDSSGFFVAA
jgi:hypothetical protein